jgi:hypothetical protein
MNMPRFLAVGVLLAACGDKQEPTTTMVTFATFTDPSADPSGDPGGAPTTGETGATGETGLTDDTGIAPPMIEGVDILFVLDNSGSMAEEQAMLADSIAALTDGLRGAQLARRDDDDRRRQPALPEHDAGGRGLVLSSCVDRVGAGEFTFADMDFSAACTDRCALTDAELVVTPTATEQDVNPAPRKWVESTVGGCSTSRGPSGTVEALRAICRRGWPAAGSSRTCSRCSGRSRRRATRGRRPTSGSCASRRVLALVMVSDETDCSFAGAHVGHLHDNKVFWEDPDAPAPTSAVCWNAGVACSGSGADVDRVPRGELGRGRGRGGVGRRTRCCSRSRPSSSSCSRSRIRRSSFDPLAEVLVGLISGVPIGYDTFDAELVYEDSPDPEFQGSFGIGPGCIVGTPNDPSLTAVPPVREREWAEAFEIDGRNLYSICDGD